MEPTASQVDAIQSADAAPLAAESLVAPGKAAAIDYSRWDNLADNDSDSDDGKPRYTHRPAKTEAERVKRMVEVFKDPRLEEQLKAACAIGSNLDAERKRLGLDDAKPSSGRALKHWRSRRCAACGTCEDEADVTLRACERCKTEHAAEPAMYCSKACQQAAWPEHKKLCGKRAPTPAEYTGTWVDKWRSTMDGSRHFGDLELITWDGEDSEGDPLGFGAVYSEYAAEERRRFKVRCKRDHERYCRERPEAFRWTCCGVCVAAGVHGCDHHGDPRAAQPCGCDFCLAGKPLTEKVWSKKLKSQPAHGLQTLCRGPDPRSVSEAGLRNWELRQVHERLGFRAESP